MIFKSSGRVRWTDITGIVSSFACVVHCLAAPLLMALGAGFLAYPPLKYLFIIIAFAAIYETTYHEVPRKVAITLWLSFWVMLFSLLLEERYPWLEYTGYLASFGIIVGHIMNIRYCKQCKVDKKSLK